MSNTLAIATVTAVLQARLRTLLDDNGMAAFASAAQPPGSDPDAGVYLHLYRVLPNPALQQQTLPTRRADGSLAMRPRLALMLHYVLTFVGNTDNTDFDAERLAGLVMTELHARPILHPDEIATFVAGLAPSHVLFDADLGDQLDRVRITPLALDLEDHSRLWGLFNQSYHGLSVAYEVSVVLLEDQVHPTTNLPVATPQVTVFPASPPQLRAAVSSAREQPLVQIFAAGSGDEESLLLRGNALAGDRTLVRIADQEFEIPVAEVADDQLQVQLSDALGLAAGVVAVQVRHEVDVDPDGGGSFRPAGASGTVAVALAPTIAAAGPATADSGDHLVDLDVVPVPGADQDLRLLLDLAGDSRASSDWELVGGTTVRFRVAGLSAGSWLLRLTVDGATSLLDGGPGGYTGPVVVVP